MPCGWRCPASWLEVGALDSLPGFATPDRARRVPAADRRPGGRPSWPTKHGSRPASRPPSGEPEAQGSRRSCCAPAGSHRSPRATTPSAVRRRGRRLRAIGARRLVCSSRSRPGRAVAREVDRGGIRGRRPGHPTAAGRWTAGGLVADAVVLDYVGHPAPRGRTAAVDAAAAAGLPVVDLLADLGAAWSLRCGHERHRAARGVWNIVPTPFLPDGALDTLPRPTLVDFVAGDGRRRPDDPRRARRGGEARRRGADAPSSQAVDRGGRRAIPVCVGVSHASTDRAIAYAREAEAAGAHSVMLAPPPLARPTDAAVLRATTSPSPTRSRSRSSSRTTRRARASR